MLLYALKDVKSGFLPITCFKNDDIAKRAFLNLANAPQPNQVSTNPEDFELWCLGSYDQDSGIIMADLHFVASVTSLEGQNG